MFSVFFGISCFGVSMNGLLIDGSDHLVGPLGVAHQTCGCGIGATAVSDEGEFVQRFRGMVEQEWQRRKRRFACRNKAPALNSFPLILRIITNYSTILALKPLTASLDFTLT